MICHTPSPWEIEPGHDGGWTLSFNGDGEYRVLAQRAPWRNRQHESEANARLICVAPTLLSGLIAEHSQRCGPAHAGFMYGCEVCALIRKAEGRK